MARASDFFYRGSKSNKNIFLRGSGGVEGLMDAQINRPKPICPFNFFELRGWGALTKVSDFFTKDPNLKCFGWGW